MPSHQPGVSVYNVTKGTFLALHARVADTHVARLVGLLGRRRLDQGSGLWIVPSNSIHTVGMLFSIDVLLLDKDNRVAGLRELVRPFSMTWPNLHAKSVLELPTHTISCSRTQAGDQLVIAAARPRLEIWLRAGTGKRPERLLNLLKPKPGQPPHYVVEDNLGIELMPWIRSLLTVSRQHPNMHHETLVRQRPCRPA